MEPLFPIPDATHVAEAVRRLIAAADPLQIVVFGSVARGEAGPDSDLDLLVVMPDGTDRREATVALLTALADLPVPKEVIVTTPSLARYHAGSHSHIVGFALDGGVLAYACPQARSTRPNGCGTLRPTSWPAISSSEQMLRRVLQLTRHSRLPKERWKAMLVVEGVIVPKVHDLLAILSKV